MPLFAPAVRSRRLRAVAIDRAHGELTADLVAWLEGSVPIRVGRWVCIAQDAASPID